MGDGMAAKVVSITPGDLSGPAQAVGADGDHLTIRARHTIPDGPGA
jgi:hypothetical protein